MKTLRNLSLMIAGLALLSACGEENEQIATQTDLVVESVQAETESVAESTFEDIDNLVEAGLASGTANGRIMEDETIRCAQVNHDEENKIITIDYGDGCEDPRGRFRSGMIIIEYSDHRYVPGAFRKVTFENFVIDSVQVSGERIITNIAESTSDTLKFNIEMNNGLLTFPDGSTLTRNASFTRTWVRGNNPLEDIGIKEGSASGTNRDGDAYTVTILERIVFKRDCHRGRKFIPVSGVKEITAGSNTAIIDYGDGTCDNLYTVAVNGGEAVEYEFGKGRFR